MSENKWNIDKYIQTHCQSVCTTYWLSNEVGSIIDQEHLHECMLSIIISQYSDACTSTKLITKLFPGVASDATIKGYSTEGCVPTKSLPICKSFGCQAIFSHLHSPHRHSCHYYHKTTSGFRSCANHYTETCCYGSSHLAPWIHTHLHHQ